ncbi:tetratricopeptide repeat protein [Exilibacterium tricleocarpae]|uniref:Tetratricopeptide repeat protein n=1 Tax=Exilibacterium tricleocarpae TaxID=2591008 RepID=A0A545SZW0_9GAMM|nr:tetratricopeptide repeat protein [Exilibacterium tricleocarpae]TQV70508.1 tetratricopeptide repeat protein [Exilibacterium tricleocarpae]
MSFFRALLLMITAVAAVVCHGQQQRSGDGYVGSGECASCHRQQYDLWRNSHHDLAMARATPATVLGNFDNARFTYYDEVTRFYRRNGDFFVKTRGENGEDHEFQVLYTFGVEPLQQYLVAFPGGRLQALAVAWDSRPRAEGGQRWFHLQPEQPIAHTDELHWSGTYFNWNSRCAECHSTNLKKNFSLAENRFATTWSEIDVACEACHGPGEKHLQWAAGTDRKSADSGLLPLRSTAVWQAVPGSHTARNTSAGAARDTVTQIDICAHCHSRRAIVSNDVFGRPFPQHHQLQLLDEGIYHPDGQVLEENYVYGSFIQSKMFHQGVTCSNCHEPHSLALRAPGNAVCTQCHSAPVFDTPKHHHHPVSSSGASCANCHMPETTYMVIDDRRDHSLRVPRPDLSVALGVPNACNQCHTDRDAKWAAAALEDWFPASRLRGEHFGHTLAAARAGDPGAEAMLIRLARAGHQPAIARATAVELLQYYPSQESLDTAVAQLADTDPLVRLSALRALAMLPPAQRLQFAGPALADPSPRVRAEAGKVLAGTPAAGLSAAQRSQLRRAQDAYIESLMVNADIADNHLNLGALYQQQGRWERAAAAFETALRIDARSVPAMLNLADWYRQQERDFKGEPLLQKALRVSPGNAAAHHSLGLLYVRQKKIPQAMQHLQQAAQRAPEVVRYTYVYSVALDSVGQTAAALEVARQALQRHPHNRELLGLRASFGRKLQNQEAQ